MLIASYFQKRSLLILLKILYHLIYFNLLLDIRTTPLKYVRFCDLNQLENDKLFELIDMIEHSLPQTVPRTDLSLYPPVLPTQHETDSISMTKINNKFTSYRSSVLPAHHKKLEQTKPTVTRLENQDISSKDSPILR